MKIDLIVIGCGGTGSHYIKELGRYLFGNYSARTSDLRVVLADGDVVEKKNLTRQAFLETDIGYNKARVMAEILQQVYEIPAEYLDEYIDEPSDIKKLIRKDAIVLLVGCVDNHQCRRSLHQVFESLENGIYMDAANEYKVGEVVIGSRIGGIEMYPDRTRYFPEVLTSEDPKRSEESCEVLNVSAPQHLITNQFAALILLSNTVRFLSEENWLGGIIYFDSFKPYVQDRTQKR